MKLRERATEAKTKHKIAVVKIICIVTASVDSMKMRELLAERMQHWTELKGRLAVSTAANVT